MDLTSQVFSILSPIAAFRPPRRGRTFESGIITRPAATTTPNATAASITTSRIALTPWQISPLNPQSRIDSLAPLVLPPSNPLPPLGSAAVNANRAQNNNNTGHAQKDDREQQNHQPQHTTPPPGTGTSTISTHRPQSRPHTHHHHHHHHHHHYNRESSSCTTWQIDTVDRQGRLWAATPRFAVDSGGGCGGSRSGGGPPLRVSVCLPPPEAFPPALRAVLRPERAVMAGSTASKVPAADLEVGRWLARVLHAWSCPVHSAASAAAAAAAAAACGPPSARSALGAGVGVGVRKGVGVGEGDEGQEWQRWWWDLPFGSMVAVDFVGNGDDNEEEVVGCKIARSGQETPGITSTAAAAAERTVQVCLVPGPGYAAEQGMISLETLKRMWEGEVSSEAWAGLRVVEWERLRFKKQLHYVISLVGLGGGDGGDNGKETVVVFKSVLREQRYMYNELKMLLLLQEHPNVVSRPLGVVTKKGRFGNRRGVCGFLLEWFPLGSLRQRLLADDYESTTPMTQKLRWARQVTQALVHINGYRETGFYPDLKPDNVLLKRDAATGMLNAVLIDLEQRGGWFAWSPPEVAYVEYLEILVDDESGLEEGEQKDEILELLRAYYDDPDWRPETAGMRYRNTKGGFSSPWLALLRQRRSDGEDRDLLERAQVFMLGKLFWCIFEGQPLVRCGIDHELLQDPDPGYETARTGKARAFPEFKRAPEVLRSLIRSCTAGAPEWAADNNQQRLPGVVLQSGKLHPAASDEHSHTQADAIQAAGTYWVREVELAKEFVRDAALFKNNQTKPGHEETPHHPVTLLEQARTRPLFSDILAELDQIEHQLVAEMRP